MIHRIDPSFLVATEVASHSRHIDTRQLLHSLNQAGNQVAFTPLVLAEFVRDVND